MMIPTLGGNYYSLIRSKVSTGQVLNLDGTFFIDGNEYYESLLGLNSVKKRVIEILDAETDIEVSVFDGDGCFVGIFKKAVDLKHFNQ